MVHLISINVKCPRCNNSLMDANTPLCGKPSILLNLTVGGRSGYVHLCSLYGSYDHHSNLEVNNGEVAEFSCPHCNAVLNIRETCDRCAAPLVMFFVDVGGRVNICSRKGCPEHHVEFEDIGETMRKFYEAYGP